MLKWSSPPRRLPWPGQPGELGEYLSDEVTGKPGQEYGGLLDRDAGRILTVYFGKAKAGEFTI